MSDHIVAVAVRHHGLTLTLPRPARHHNIFQIAYDAKMADSMAIAEQGFITNDGTFVDRRLGLEIARKANQLLEGKDHDGKRELFSEDAW